MYNFEDFQTALNNCIEGYDPGDFPEIIKWREDIYKLSDVFLAHYGFRLLDTEIYFIWRDYSDSYCANWLTLHEDKIVVDCFNDFVERYLK